MFCFLNNWKARNNNKQERNVLKSEFTVEGSQFLPKV
jgi:hypothetical protein